MTKSKTVKEIQSLLNRAGFAVLVDGEFGPETKSAVRAFQRSKGLEDDGVVGPITMAALHAGNFEAPEVPAKPSDSETPWMDWMAPHLGAKEISGRKHNPFIVGLFAYTTYDTTKDETPWCAALVNAALIKTGFKGTRSAAAASFDKYGTKCPLKYGAVVTLRHKNGGRHVTFFVKLDPKGRMVCRGGNQGNALKDSTYARSELVASRWPVKK